MSLSDSCLFDLSGGNATILLSNLTISSFTSTISGGSLINAPKATESPIALTVNGLTLTDDVLFSASEKGLIYVANSSRGVTIENSTFGSIVVRFFLFYFLFLFYYCCVMYMFVSFISAAPPVWVQSLILSVLHNFL
jgi:hypothetical protein